MTQAYIVRVDETTVHRFLHGSEERGEITRDPYTRRKAMAMTAEAMNTMFLALTEKQAEISEKAALAAATAAQTAMDRQAKTNQEMMDRMMTTIREEATARKADEATSRDKTEKKYPSKLNDNRIDPKMLSRVNKFEGGESGYKEWALDIEITVESMCPGFREMLNTYMSNPSLRGEKPAILAQAQAMSCGQLTTILPTMAHHMHRTTMELTREVASR